MKKFTLDTIALSIVLLGLIPSCGYESKPSTQTVIRYVPGAQLNTTPTPVDTDKDGTIDFWIK